MTRPKSDNVKLGKVHSTPKKGYKLGSSSASWRKIKSVTSNSKLKGTTLNNNTENYLNEQEDKPLIDHGEKGELFVAYPSYNKIEIWDWVPKIPEDKFESDAMYLHGQYAITISINENNHKSFPDADLSNERHLHEIRYLNGKLGNDITMLLLIRMNTNWMFEIHTLPCNSNESYVSQYITIPRYLQEMNSKSATNFKLKVSKDIIIYGNQEGYIYILKYDSDSRKYLPGNSNSNLNKLKTGSKQQFSKEVNSNMSDDEILFQTSCFDKVPIFDLVGHWLVYSPVKDEYKNLTSDMEPSSVSIDDFDPLLSHNEKNNTSSKSKVFTPVKLPPPGPLLNRLISTVSSNALDGIFKISEASSTIVRDYLNKEKRIKESNVDDKEMNQLLNSIGKTLGKILYSTATTTVSTIQRSTINLKQSDNQLIKIVDLLNDRSMATFKAPGGVSNISLSPYDLQLVHSSLRGDSFYMWDLHKLPNEASLIGKFIRGKTSAIIRDIFWFINNHDHDIVGNNLGFGCISNSGTVHWFNVNYLFGNLSNHPNILGKENLDDSIKGDKFLDSWILSSLNARNFIKLPNISNSTKTNNKYIYFNQLAIIDDKNQIKLLSSLNGNHQFKYEIPDQPVTSGMECSNFIRNTSEPEMKIHPLSQTEIETCAPYLNLVNNKHITFSTYNFNEEDNAFNNLLSHYNYFGGDIPTHLIKLPNNNYENELKNYGDILANEFQSIVLDEAAN